MIGECSCCDPMWWWNFEYLISCKIKQIHDSLFIWIWK